jgi:hypothetical protein
VVLLENIGRKFFDKLPRVSILRTTGIHELEKISPAG